MGAGAGIAHRAALGTRKRLTRPFGGPNVALDEDPRCGPVMFMAPAEDLSELANCLRCVLPAETVVEVTTEASLDALLPDEAAATKEWAPQRQLQFAAGRLCARRALARLRYPAVPILFDAEGAPIWPSGVVGSISHKRQNCVVTVARSSRTRGLGVDLECHIAESRESEAEIVRRVCVKASERRQAKTLRGATKSPGTLFLSAKEAFFKFQFPLTGTLLSWADVEIIVGDRGFRARAPARSSFPSASGVIVSTGCWLAAVCF